MIKQRWFIILFVLVGLGAGLLLWMRHQKEDNNTQSAATVNAVEDDGSLSMQMAWKTDSRQMYNLRFESIISMNGGQVKAEVSGTLNTRVLKVSDTVFVAFQLSPVTVRMNEESSPYLAEVYTNLVIGVFEKHGSVLEVMSSAFMNKQDKQALANLIYSMQYVILPEPERDSNSSWNTEEKDVNGSFVASYSETNGMVQKQKSFYTTYPEETEGKLSVSVLSSSIQAELSKSCWLSELEGHEQLDVVLDEKPFLKSDSAWSIKQIPFAPDPSLAIWKDYGSLEEWMKAVALFGQGEDMSEAHLAALEKQRMEELRAKYENVSVSAMVADLIQSINMGEGHTATIPAIHAMRDYFKVYPERAAEVPLKIKTEKLGDQVAGRIIHALELAGNPQAQSALTEISLDAEQAGNQRLQSIVAIGGVENPTEESLSRLNDLAEGISTEQGIRNNSWLALGQMSTKADPESKGQIREQLIQLMDNESDQDVALLGLDNAGGAPMDIVTNSIANADARIRSYAIKNLRHHKGPEAKLLLEEALSDASQRVRRTTLIVLRDYADTQSDRIIRDHYVNETDEGLKSSIIRHLGSRSDVSENRQLLEELQQTESNPKLKESIRKALLPPVDPTPDFSQLKRDSSL